MKDTYTNWYSLLCLSTHTLFKKKINPKSNYYKAWPHRIVYEYSLLCIVKITTKKRTCHYYRNKEFSLCFDKAALCVLSDAPPPPLIQLKLCHSVSPEWKSRVDRTRQGTEVKMISLPFRKTQSQRSPELLSNGSTYEIDRCAAEVATRCWRPSCTITEWRGNGHARGSPKTGFSILQALCLS